MKELFDNVIKEAQDVSQASQTLTLEVKAECLHEININRAKMHELESMQSDVKRIKENVEKELGRITEESDKQKRVSYAQQMDIQERLEKTETAVKLINDRSQVDLDFMKQQILDVDRDLKQTEFYTNKI